MDWIFMISIQPGSSLAQRIFLNETGDEAKPKSTVNNVGIVYE